VGEFRIDAGITRPGTVDQGPPPRQKGGADRNDALATALEWCRERYGLITSGCPAA